VGPRGSGGDGGCRIRNNPWVSREIKRTTWVVWVYRLGMNNYLGCMEIIWDICGVYGIIWIIFFVKLETTHVMTYGLHYTLSLIMIVQWTLEDFGRRILLIFQSPVFFDKSMKSHCNEKLPSCQWSETWFP